MKLIIVLVVLCIVLLTITFFRKGHPPADQHKAPPLQGSAMSQDETSKRIESITQSPYYNSLKPLKEHVKGKTVLESQAGNAGFILMLSGESWAAAYRSGNEVGFRFGNGKPDSKSLNAIRSSDYGDASEPLKENLPYSNQRCDISAEVKKSHGQQIEGLSVGMGTFNFAFVGGRELDFHLVNDRSGKPSVRVFWEQW